MNNKELNAEDSKYQYVKYGNINDRRLTHSKTMRRKNKIIIKGDK